MMWLVRTEAPGQGRLEEARRVVQRRTTGNGGANKNGEEGNRNLRCSEEKWKVVCSCPSAVLTRKRVKLQLLQLRLTEAHLLIGC